MVAGGGGGSGGGGGGVVGHICFCFLAHLSTKCSW